MDILVLEDSDSKFDELKAHVGTVLGVVSVLRAALLSDFLRYLERQKFDVVVVDLLVPRFKDSKEAEDVTSDILDAISDRACKNNRTMVVALTAFVEASDNNYKALNAADVLVLTFDLDGKWREPLANKYLIAKPKKRFDVVIVCALPKEVQGFVHAGYKVGNAFLHGILDCREIEIGDKQGVIVTAAPNGSCQLCNYDHPGNRGIRS
jgi:CheY-like chemotaxis protein